MKASAGSGKTFRLARKYIEILLDSNDRYAYRHILAVTFTNKATDEMKDRIIKELFKLAGNPEKSKYFKYFNENKGFSKEYIQQKSAMALSDILHDYSAFSVSTIDRFFQQTLKAFSREIGQFASYQVELDRDSLVGESVDRILDNLTEDDSQLLSWLTDNVLEQIEQGGKYSLDANLTEMALRLKSQQRTQALEKAGLSAEEEYSKDKLLKIRNVCRGIMSNFSDSVRSAANAALDILHQAGVDPAESNRKFMNQFYNYSQLDDTDLVQMPTESFMTKAMDSDQWFAKTKAPKYMPLVYPFLEAPLEDFCALFAQPFKLYNTALNLDKQLFGLGRVGVLNRSFMELMKEKYGLCIDDSNTILRDIIDGSDAPFVYEKLGVRYENFLLDEFQDTSEVQWENFSPLLKESDSKDGKNLVVGDVKQSIYRWRGSDWKLLNERIPQEFPRFTGEVLDENFRSGENIINFNNLFFKTASQLLDRIADDAATPLTKIYSDVAQKPGRDERGHKIIPEMGNLRFSFCEKENELEEVLNSVVSAQKDGAKLSEIAVLVRSNASGEDVAMYLINNGIPVVTDDSLRVKGSLMVRRITSLMSYTANPNDSVNGYLASSLDITMPDSSESLTDLAEELYRRLKEASFDGQYDGEILHIQSFMDKIQEYVSSNGNNLRGFLKYWENENPSIASPSSGESVRVMTIHKAKGLSFPYVIIPFVENINLYKASKYWCVPELGDTSLAGIAEGVYDVTLSKSSADTLFSEDYKKENFLQMVDNINTIYVAMTRPVLGLHIIAKRPSDKQRDLICAGDKNSFKDFSQILYWYLNASATATDILGNEELLPPFEIKAYVSEEGTEKFEIGDAIDYNQARKEEVDDSLSFDSAEAYPSIPLNDRLKVSLDSRDFFSEEGDTGVSASYRLKGIVMHDILSNLNNPEDLQNAVNQSFLKGDLSADEASQTYKFLSKRLETALSRGWFPGAEGRVLNESALIDIDGQIYRPDRVIISDGKISIVDYKTGKPKEEHVEQLRNYAKMWSRMGYENVSSYLWYLMSNQVLEV